MALRLRVTWDQARFCTVRAEKSWTVEQLKTAISQQTGLGTQELRLYYDTGRRGLVELLEDQTLSVIRGYGGDICLVRGHPRRVEWLKRVALDWQALEAAPKALQDDYDTVLEALQQDGRALMWASEKLRDDRDIVRYAVDQTPLALEYASESLRGDWDVVMAALAKDVTALCFASEAIRSDRELVLQAVAQNGALLEFAADALQADREVVLAAVTDCGAALQFASEELRGDRDVALMAVQETPFALEHVAPDLASDRELIQAALQEGKEGADVTDKPAVPEAYRWMGVSKAAMAPKPSEEEEEDKMREDSRKTPDWWAQAEQAAEEVTLGEEERLRFAIHWLLEPGAAGQPALVHRWVEGLRLTPMPACANCIFGRHLWCVQCGPAAMTEAEEAMKSLERNNKDIIKVERAKVAKFLGHGLFFSEMDLRAGAFKGVPRR